MNKKDDKRGYRTASEYAAAAAARIQVRGQHSSIYSKVRKISDENWR